ncbi:MAG: asparagine synthase C-terminal domain-containing protein [Desulfovibrio sp.]|jgi:asparagine synthase (glutamine-hydrolysing)|nr:asparagine synthase C-terminal domain-containing protein [Desulfovibrio sp.]
MCGIFGRDPSPPWLDMEALGERDVTCAMQDERARLYPGCKDRVRQTLAYNLTWEGLQMLLRHGDRNSMAFSVESRVPFLTREMAEFCLSLPEEYLIDMNWRTKSVFREAMRGLVPDEILDRRDKIGFATPERDWLEVLSPWVEEVLASARDIPYLKPDTARTEWLAIRKGEKIFDWRVWRWINYVRWASLFRVEV